MQSDDDRRSRSSTKSGEILIKEIQTAANYIISDVAGFVQVNDYNWPAWVAIPNSVNNFTELIELRMVTFVK